MARHFITFSGRPFLFRLRESGGEVDCCLDPLATCTSSLSACSLDISSSGPPLALPSRFSISVAFFSALLLYGGTYPSEVWGLSASFSESGDPSVEPCKQRQWQEHNVSSPKELHQVNSEYSDCLFRRIPMWENCSTQKYWQRQWGMTSWKQDLKREGLVRIFTEEYHTTSLSLDWDRFANSSTVILHQIPNYLNVVLETVSVRRAPVQQESPDWLALRVGKLDS